MQQLKQKVKFHSYPWCNYITSGITAGRGLPLMPLYYQYQIFDWTALTRKVPESVRVEGKTPTSVFLKRSIPQIEYFKIATIGVLLFTFPFIM